MCLIITKMITKDNVSRTTFCSSFGDGEFVHKTGRHPASWSPGCWSRPRGASKLASDFGCFVSWEPKIHNTCLESRKATLLELGHHLMKGHVISESKSMLQSLRCDWF